MLNKIIKIIIFILAVSLISLFQISVPGLWLNWLSAFNLIPVILVSILLFYDSKLAIITALIFGLYLDLFSFTFFGLESISLLISLFLVERISFAWLTNRSLYSFVLINIIFVFLYSFLSFLLSYFSSASYAQFFIFQGYFWMTILARIFWSAILALILFIPVVSWTKGLRPVFLEKN